ncbi:hypothetical protein [uncultured Parolsenella sp.]|uniref:hypothetical protein n=1 Tax=uncultured Parolsenella sp. TaxID=2083008 RepID=UPI0025F295EC|nr:hypothetical protein [uncultured Parolsenella sp.]
MSEGTQAFFSSAYLPAILLINAAFQTMLSQEMQLFRPYLRKRCSFSGFMVLAIAAFRGLTDTRMQLFMAEKNG